MISLSFENLYSQKRGSALLVAMLIMGILMAVSLLLSTLILREMYVTRALLDSGKAFYAAESGIEMSLYNLNTQLPGWQVSNNKNEYALLALDEDADVVGEYRVDNRCSAFPCFSSDFDVSSGIHSDRVIGALNDEFAKVFYYELDLNETLTIPLFVSDNGEVLDVKDFTVEFWSPMDVETDLNVDFNGSLSSWDVLRWKIMGFEVLDGDANNNFGATESVSDFTALSSGTDASEPSWFGTVNCNASSYVGSRYVDGIKCNSYFIDSKGEICSNTEAREFYDYSGEGDERQILSEDIRQCYPIKEFLTSHSLNYLTLTNLINQSVFKPALAVDRKEAISKLYVRVEFFGGGAVNFDPKGVIPRVKAIEGLSGSGRHFSNETVREFAEIYASGYSGGIKKSLSAKIRKDSFMPVFNYSLYSTYKGDE